MKTINKLLMTSLLLSSFQVFAGDGAGGGNGGGGICISKDKCVTLAEAGLRIPRGEIQLFMISQELEQELKRVLQTLPLGEWRKKDLLDQYLGKRNTFIKVEESNKRKFKKIVHGYKELIKQYAPSLPEERFTLYAVSENEKTYLLPKFFDLSLTDQALILIHEGNVRGRPSSVVPKAVQFDGMVYDFLYNPEKTSSIDFFLSFYDLTQASEELFANILTYYTSKLGRQILVTDFCSENLFWERKPFSSASEHSVLSGGWMSSLCEVGREKAIEGRIHIDSTFAKLFYGMSLQLNTILGAPYISPEHSSDSFTRFFEKEAIPTLCEGTRSNDQLLVPGYNRQFVAVVDCKQVNGKMVADKVYNIKIEGIVTH